MAAAAAAAAPAMYRRHGRTWLPAWLSRRRWRRLVATAQKEPSAATHSASSPSAGGGGSGRVRGERHVSEACARMAS